MERYFDAFLYFANWGSRWFMLRLPKKLLDANTAEPYCTGETVSCHEKDDYTILSFSADFEDYDDDEGSGWLASLVPIRSELMHGDFRALYLGWLLGVQLGEVNDEDVEPPLPPGLGQLNAALDQLADFLSIDPDLIAAAAEQSAQEDVSTPSAKEIGEWVRALPSAEKDAIITRLIAGDAPHLPFEVRRRAIFEIHGGAASDPEQRRTAGEILLRAKAMSAERKKKDAEQRAREKAERERAEAELRRKRLEALARRQNDLWSAVDKLIATKQPRRYDEAVATLKDLHDIAELKDNRADFKFRLRELQRNHSAKITLIERLRKSKLLE
jgi:hypothetical protein